MDYGRIDLFMKKYYVRTFYKTTEFFEVILARDMYDAEDLVIEHLMSNDKEYVDLQRQKISDINFKLCLN